MRILADTNLFIKFCRRLPLPREVESALEDETNERCLSPISVLELFRLWKKGEVRIDPDSWLDLALPSWSILPVTVPIARQSALWPWSHKDPADRMIAATALIEDVELWHTDMVLKECSGFKHRYFQNLSEEPPVQPPT